MKKILKTIAILLILAGSVSCGKDDGIDMSKIDFSNIEDLYAQPLPVIQKAVQGKWKVYQAITDGFIYDVQYPENRFIELEGDHYIEINDESQKVVYFTWKNLAIENWRSPLNGHKTYVMWEGYRNYFFERIKNDTLTMGAQSAPDWLNVIRVK